MKHPVLFLKIQRITGKIFKYTFTTAQTGGANCLLLMSHPDNVNLQSFTAAQCTLWLPLWTLVQMVIIVSCCSSCD
jgi:hypothetical protein